MRATTAALLKSQVRWVMHRLGIQPLAVIATYLENLLGHWGLQSRRGRASGQRSAARAKNPFGCRSPGSVLPTPVPQWSGTCLRHISWDATSSTGTSSRRARTAPGSWSSAGTCFPSTADRPHHDRLRQLQPAPDRCQRPLGWGMGRNFAPLLERRRDPLAIADIGCRSQPAVRNSRGIACHSKEPPCYR